MMTTRTATRAIRGIHLFAVLLLLAGTVRLCADVKLADIFTDHMVLQRDKPLPIWGWAKPQEAIRISLAGNTVNAVANAEGRWRATLPALPAGGPHTLTVSGNNTLTLGDILVGEVWICSGQSNMEWPLRAAESATKALAEAQQPAIRFFRIGHVASPVPLDTVRASWTPCTPDTARDATAVGFFFGLDLHRELDVPIGLIDSNWGGTRIEPWTPPEGFLAVEKTRPLYDKVMMALPGSPVYKKAMGTYLDSLRTWIETMKTAMAEEQAATPCPEMPDGLKPLSRPTDPCALYNGMIHPFVPFAIRGVIWYQGESNRFDAHLYAYKMRALVEGWRAIWQQGDFPFYWVQLAPYIYGKESPRGLPRIWEAQTMALDLPNTGMAVINDIGNLHNIHPRNKRDVGKRLALIAKANVYGRKDIVWSSPTLKDYRIDGNRIVLTFDHVGKGLRSRDGKSLTWFELMDADGAVVKATATLQGPDTVVVSSADLEKPVGVRFAWDQSAEPNLVNSAGLPAGAFRAGKVEPKNPITKLTPMAKGFLTAYVLDIPVKCGYNENAPAYTIDHTKDLTTPFDRIAYCLELQKKGGKKHFIFVSMNAFTGDIHKIGVPTVDTRAFFQQDVGPLTVASNVKGIPQGTDVGKGFLEFWPSSYSPQNQRGVPGASDTVFDFGDGGGTAGTKGYGSMQIHIPARRLTLFAFNCWGHNGSCELGIGNSPVGNPDWTFRSNAADYTLRRLTILVRLDQ